MYLKERSVQSLFNWNWTVSLKCRPSIRVINNLSFLLLIMLPALHLINTQWVIHFQCDVRYIWFILFIINDIVKMQRFLRHVVWVIMVGNWRTDDDNVLTKKLTKKFLNYAVMVRASYITGTLKVHNVNVTLYSAYVTFCF